VLFWTAADFHEDETTTLLSRMTWRRRYSLRSVVLLTRRPTGWRIVGRSAVAARPACDRASSRSSHCLEASAANLANAGKPGDDAKRRFRAAAVQTLARLGLDTISAGNEAPMTPLARAELSSAGMHGHRIPVHSPALPALAEP
jgi:hypothetical protein